MKYDRIIFRNADGNLTTFAWEDVELLISQDGYVRINAPDFKRMELILTFDQVVAAMQEERDLWN